MKKFKSIKSVSFILSLLLLMGINYIPAKAVDNAEKIVDISVTVDPTVTMSTTTSTISFGTLTPLTTNNDKLAAVTVNVQSNNTFKLTTQATGDFAGAKAGNVITIDKLKVKLGSSTTWLTMSKTAPVVLTASQPATSGQAFPVDFRLELPWTSAVPDSYTTTVKFLASQI